MKIRRLIRSILAGFMAVSISICALPVSAYAESYFTKVGADVLQAADGGLYYLNVIGGTKAFIPLDLSKYQRDADKIKRALTTDLGITSTDGSMANTAAFRYGGFGSRYANLFKYASTDGLRQNGEWLMPTFDVGDTVNITPRYAGIGITSTALENKSNVMGQAITNPDFVSDSVQASGSGTQTTATVYRRSSSTGDLAATTETAYGQGGTVYDLSTIYTNGKDGTSFYAGSGIVLSNKATGMNNDSSTAQKAFTKWLNSGSEYAAYYKERAEAAISWAKSGGDTATGNLQWWQLLNRYFQINGDPTDDNQSVYFYMVGGKLSGKIFYRTYSIPGNIENNVSPTDFVVRDTSGKILGESYRNVSEMDEYEGCGSGHEYSGVISLEASQMYSVDAILTYFSKVRSSTNNPSSSINFYAISLSNTNVTPISLVNLSSGSFSGTNGMAHATSASGVSGRITTSGSVNGYRYGSAGFGTNAFQVTSDMPTSGYLCVSVPTRYSEYGDNDVTTDDVLRIRYTLTEAPQENQMRDAYGDMNLGQLEYRQYNYFSTSQVEDKEKPILDDEGKETGEYEQKTIIEQNYSEYSHIYSASAGESYANYSYEVEDDTLPQEDQKNIWHEGKGWWEYDESWPSNDENWKCWVYDDDVETAVNQYTRGIPFGLGFTVSRSRGIIGTTVENPSVEVEIYGVAPGSSDELIKSFTVVGNSSLDVYSYTYALKNNMVISKADNGIEDYPRFRVEARISDSHGESGIWSSSAGKKAPYNNGWQTEHDYVSRTFESECDDMRIKEIEIVDSEGVVVYHADRDSEGNLVADVEGAFDREEDLSLKVVVEQTYSANHNVHNPSIDVSISGYNSDSGEYTTYIDQSGDNCLCKEGVVMSGEGDTVTFEGIYFRPRDSHSLVVNIDINDRHNYGNWNENEWNNADDSFSHTFNSTTADLAMRQNIELYNSKNNPQEYLTFAEYLDFKFTAEHHGSSETQMAVVGGSTINPYVKVYARIYDADSLTSVPTTGKLMYGNVVSDDPMAASALLMEDKNVTASTRLFPGLGSNGYASHVQLWMNNYVVQSHVVESGNVAAYGHILVTGEIDKQHDNNSTNVRNNVEDYVQKEFIGEKNFKIAAIAANCRNAIAEDARISVQVAVQNMASSYNDQTIVDKTYLDIYVDGDLYSTSEIEIPVGDTVVTEVIVDKPVFISQTTNPSTGELMEVVKDQVEVEARVNWGEHQTHYEYVLKSTDASLYPDPFADNTLTTVVKPHLPDLYNFPNINIDDNTMVSTVFDDDIVNDYDEQAVSSGKYEIYYNANDGTTSSILGEVNFKSSITLRANGFARAGYIFNGWNTSPDGSGTTYENQQVVAIPTKEECGDNTKLNLYAQWEPVSYTIKFNANGGTGSMDPITLSYDVARYLPDSTFSRDGYVFVGWTVGAANAGDVLDNGSLVKNLSSTNNSEVKLYAKWVATADCIIMEEYDTSVASSLRPGQTFAENPSVKSFADYATYAFMRVRIPTVLAKKAGDTTSQVYDLLEPDWNYTDWELVSSNVSTTAGTPSEYIFVYKYALSAEGEGGTNPHDSTRTADRTTDLFTHYSVGDFTGGTYHGTTELVGAIVEADDSLPDAFSAAAAANELFATVD